MTHKHRHKQIQRIKKKYKNLAGIVAAATLLSTTMLPGIPASVAHAASVSSSSDMTATTSQDIGKTTASPSHINISPKDTPIKEIKQETKQEVKTPKPAPETKQETKTPQPAPETKQETKTPQPTPETKQEAKTPQPAPETKQEAKTPQPAPETEQEVKTPQPAPETKQEANNPPSDYQHVLEVSATAYAPGPHDNDQWGNKTYIGSQVRPGIIAVDPNVIPLGSRVYLQYPDGHGEYAVAEDTGGAIKGNRVDVAKWTVGEAQDFGIQKVKVFVINTPEKK